MRQLVPIILTFLLTTFAFNYSSATTLQGKRIATGGVQSLFVDGSAHVWAWGLAGTKYYTEVPPVPVLSDGQFVAASMTGGVSLVIKHDGSL